MDESAMSTESAVDRSQMKLIAFGMWLCDANANQAHSRIKEKSSLDHVPSVNTFHRWFTQFKMGDRTFGDRPRAGRPKSSSCGDNVLAVQRCLEEHKAWSVSKLSVATGIPKSTIGKILRDELKMKKTPKTKIWVPIKKDPTKKRKKNGQIVDMNVPTV